MHKETQVALDCPYCGESIFETLSWFKRAYFTCPLCDNGLADSQFAAVISALEQSMDESIEEMIHGRPHGGGCCGTGS